MKFEMQPVESTGKIVSAATVHVSRSVAMRHNAVPDAEAIERAKTNFQEAGLLGVLPLIDLLASLETNEDVIGYFGFTFDRHNLTGTPLHEGETLEERGMKIMRLPHPQWGNRYGNATAIGDLVNLSQDSTLRNLNTEQRAVLNEAFSEGATFLAQSTSRGRS